ncbi:MAG: sulfotransferase family 2 domain-containing protein, partial [Patescibacteria group bacterium]
MIISHKHKFIFLKPRKVAGTSVELALAAHCGAEDIVTPVSDYSAEADDDRYEQAPRNYEALGFYNHMEPAAVRERVGAAVWDSYYKLTVVRNPWDLMVSKYWWDVALAQRGSVSQAAADGHVATANRPKQLGLVSKIRKKMALRLGDFNGYVRQSVKVFGNTTFYFWPDGGEVCDFYIRYENLNEDYRRAGERLGMPVVELPRTKNKSRSDQQHYSEYYDTKTAKLVGEIFA